MPNNTIIRAGRHCLTNLHVHLVFVTKYQGKVLTHQHHQRLQQIFTTVANDFGAQLKECNGEHDHVHLLITYPPKTSVSKLINSLKGVSSRLLRKEYPNIPTHKNHLWSPSYFAASCGGAPLHIIKQYIQNQQTPRR